MALPWRSSEDRITGGDPRNEVHVEMRLDIAKNRIVHPIHRYRLCDCQCCLLHVGDKSRSSTLIQVDKIFDVLVIDQKATARKARIVIEPKRADA